MLKIEVDFLFGVFSTSKLVSILKIFQSLVKYRRNNGLDFLVDNAYL